MTEAENYTVLARKYRPKTLDELIGQEALVRTLKNALKTGRLAHAFLLTGIRGVGKTSTARIVARELNSIPADEQVDSHVDVVEMDAASNTGVDDVREIIEQVKYKPLSAPYKIFIIDEVHMLSKGAFNALLKTLEEPPEHVKFLFATTEIRKVPVTILSRCQRFDLRRVEAEDIAKHLKNIALQENISVEDEAIKFISNAAEGSVRDSLSLLDQATAYSEGKVTAATVADMLGYADRAQVIELFENLMAGDIAKSIQIFERVSNTSAEPEQLMRDLLEFTHIVTRVKITPDLKPENVTSEELKNAQALADKLSMQSLHIVWQMLLKAVGELKLAPNPKQAAEMALIRISYASSADLSSPDPGGKLSKPKMNGLTDSTNGSANGSAGSDYQGELLGAPTEFAELVQMFKSQGELRLHENLRSDVKLVSFAPGKLEIAVTEDAPQDLANKVSSFLKAWTGERWIVIVSSDSSGKTLEQVEAEKFSTLKDEAQNEPIVQKIFDIFPEAEIIGVKEIVQNNQNQKTGSEDK